MTFKKGGAKKTSTETTPKKGGSPRRLGEVLRTKDESSVYLKLAKKITVHQDDGTTQTLDANDIISLNKPMDFFNYLHDAGKISEDDLSQKEEDYGDGGKLEFVRFFVNLPVKK